VKSNVLLVGVAWAASLVLAGCAGMLGRGPSPAQAPRVVDGDVLENFARQALRPQSLTARGNLTFSFRGQTQPRIKGLLRWVRTQDDLRVRLTGIGAFGMTVFDCLLGQGALYLYVPSKEAVYVGRNEEILEGRSFGDLIQEVGWFLSPWAVFHAEDWETVPCDRDAADGSGAGGLCLIFFTGAQLGFAHFDEATMAPFSLELPDISVHYDSPVGLRDGTPYPSRISARLREFPLTVQVHLKEMKVGSLAPADEMFDPSPFLGLPMLPLQGLFDHPR